jgi:hypothetical protein
MKDADLKRNASGYYDETCYKAITSPPKAGEVWQYRMTGAYMLVLGGNEKITSCLKLVKNFTVFESPSIISVTIGEEELYTDPVMIDYTFNDKLEGYVTKLPADQMKAVQKAVGKYLGITADPDVIPVKKNENLLMDYNMAVDIANDLHAESIELSREIDKLKVYKDMYMDLIDKLVAVRGGTVND